MNSANTLSKDQDLRPGDFDVALARIAGIMAASIGRMRLDADPGPTLLSGTELVAWHVIDALRGLIPEYDGLNPVEIAQRDGLVGIVSRLAKVPQERFAKYAVSAYLSFRLSILALQRGAVPVSPVRAPGLLDALFSPVHRRAARRYLADFTVRTDLGLVHVDFAAAWRFGTPPIRSRIAPHDFDHLNGRQFLVIVALITLILAADSWCVTANPVDVLSLALIHGGAKRWSAGSEAFKRAVAEALVVATRKDIVLEEFGKEPRAWDRVLSDITAEWASSLLLAFIQLTGAPKAARFSLIRFLKELERDAHKSEGSELIEEHLRRLGRVVVNLDAEGVAEVGREDDRIESIPAVQDIRSHLRTMPLTKREREVLNLRAQNWDFHRIGDHLGISASTARVLMMRVRRAAGQQHLSSTRHQSTERRQLART